MENGKLKLSQCNINLVLTRIVCTLVLLSEVIECRDDNNYKYNNTQCVTYSNLRYANYSSFIDSYTNHLVFPENYCYGVLSYNITKEAYDNIINYNLEAFRRYRKFLNLYHIYNTTSDFSALTMDSGCLPYFRYVSCYSVFNACEESDDGNSYIENTICESTCNTYFNRCGAYTNLGICLNNSTKGYCAGVNHSEKIKISYFLAFLILTLIVI